MRVVLPAGAPLLASARTYSRIAHCSVISVRSTTGSLLPLPSFQSLRQPGALPTRIVQRCACASSSAGHPDETHLSDSAYDVDDDTGKNENTNNSTTFKKTANPGFYNGQQQQQQQQQQHQSEDQRLLFPIHGPLQRISAQVGIAARLAQNETDRELKLAYLARERQLREKELLLLAHFLNTERDRTPYFVDGDVLPRPGPPRPKSRPRSASYSSSNKTPSGSRSSTSGNSNGPDDVERTEAGGRPGRVADSMSPAGPFRSGSRGEY